MFNFPSKGGYNWSLITYWKVGTENIPFKRQGTLLRIKLKSGAS